jgi:drug/metabolite transporter (DMT)-like permease
MKNMPPHLRAVFYALAGYAGWTGSDSMLKLAGATGAPRHEILFLSGLSGALVVTTFALLQGKPEILRPKKLGGLFLLGLLYMLTLVALIIAVRHLPLANFYAVIFLAPLLIAAGAAFFMHEPLSLKQGLAILVGFAGVIIAINPVNLFKGGGDLVSYGAAFAELLLFVLQMLVMRKISHHETRECMALSTRIVSACSMLVACLFLPYAPLPSIALLGALASGLFGGLGWIMIAHSHKLAPAATVAPFQYVQLIVGALAGYALWGDVPSPSVILGALIIVASGLYIANHARKNAAAVPAEI